MSVPTKTLGRLLLAVSGTLLIPGLAFAQVSLPKSPTGVQGYYLQATTANRNSVQNATGTFVFIVWNGLSAETDTACTDTTCAPYWKGYRVRRTIEGISPNPFEVIGQWKARDSVVPLCLAEQQPCDLQNFTFTGTGVFFKGFQHNQIGPGQFVIDYPKGSPVDADPGARIFVDPGALVGFPTQYAVTSIDTTRTVNSDFYESPIDSSQIVRLTPSTGPAPNMEHVAVVPNPYKGSAEWDPPGGRAVHFINLPAGSTVRIYTAAGELLRVLTQDTNSSAGGQTGELVWDLKNAHGSSVVSGIYIYTVHPPDGRTPKKGHFVIIK
jgi:hypothetical protein